MEQESKKDERKPDRCFPSGQLRCFVLFVVIASLLACVVFQFITLFTMERRLALVERELNEISRERSKHSLSEIETKGSLSHARHKRNANPTPVCQTLVKDLLHWKAGTVCHDKGNIQYSYLSVTKTNYTKCFLTLHTTHILIKVVTSLKRNKI